MARRISRPETRSLDFAGPKQAAAFYHGPSPLCLSGGYNAAKTVTMVLKMLFIADRYPGYRWVIGRKVWDELKKTTLSSFFKFCHKSMWEPHGRRSDADKILELNNGSSFIWLHLDDPDALTIVRGLEINGFFLDQAEELDEEIFTALLPRLGRWDQVEVPQERLDEWEAANPGKPWPWIHERTDRPMPPSFALLTCNPDHEMHWIYRMFHPESADFRRKQFMVEHRPFCLRAHRCQCAITLPSGTYKPGDYYSYRDQGYTMIEVTAYDNKYATEESIQHMERQDEAVKWWMLYGKWGRPEGRVHHVRDESLLEPTAPVLAYIQNNCTLHRSMDHGISAPTCVLWWAADREGNVFCYREYYKPNLLISEHRENVWRLSDGEQYRLNLADPSIAAKSMQKSGQVWSVREEWADTQALPRDTAVYWDLATNEESGTRNKISERLRPSGFLVNEDGKIVEKPRPHPITHEMGLWPRLFFVKQTEDYPNGCDYVIRETKAQRLEKIGTENGKPIFSDDRDPRVSDHGYDCLRYYISAQSPLPYTAPVKYGANSWNAWSDRVMANYHKSGPPVDMVKRYG